MKTLNISSNLKLPLEAVTPDLRVAGQAPRREDLRRNALIEESGTSLRAAETLWPEPVAA
jgi:hypothetical protein